MYNVIYTYTILVPITPYTLDLYFKKESARIQRLIVYMTAHYDTCRLLAYRL